MKKRHLILAIAATLMAQGAGATNGYFTHGTGAKNKAMAGAGTAIPDEAISVANNPASAVLVGDAFDFGVSVFSPRRSYTASQSQVNGNFGAFTVGAGKIDSGSEWFPIPYIAKTWQVWDDSAFAVAFYGRGGMNTDFSGGSAIFDPDGPGPAPVMTLPGTFGAGTTGVDLVQAFLDVTYATRLNDRVSLGVAAVIGMQAFEAEGVGTFAPFTQTFASSGGTAFPANLSNNGHEFSTGIGVKVGVHSQLSESVALALSYQSEIKMSEFDDYADLFAEGGDFDIPSSLKAGISFRSSDSMTWSFDVEHTEFSEIDAVGNAFANLFSCPTAGAGGADLGSCLGGDTGAGFGWDDVTTYKLGVEWERNSEWTWRAGISQADQPIAESEVLFNILAPGVVENHFTVGFTRALSDNREISFSAMYAPSETVRGSSPFDPTQTIELEMDQFEFEISYGWK
ncbi:MAG: outer membrane protein transport protein [Xanthomonadales bacterium]|nr:outer membrane protein transport protein [Xanthomonadales bacterium]